MRVMLLCLLMTAAACRAAADEGFGLKFDIHQHMPACARPDVPKCGQPDIAGYLPLHFCIYEDVRASCPAMCRDCLASSCISHEGKTYELGEQWVNRFGRFTCSFHNVVHEQVQEGPIRCEQTGAEAIQGRRKRDIRSYQNRRERKKRDVRRIYETIRGRQKREDSKALRQREKRDTDECPMQYFVVSPDHSRCLTPPHREHQGMGDWQTRRSVVDSHNMKRGTVGTNDGQPVPTNMMKVTWDWELTKTAQKWASNCIYKHDEKFNRHVAGRFAVGQNIAKSSVYDWDTAVNMWWAEIEDFGFGVGSINGKPVGHYTQMAWAGSTRIGCGYALCNETEHFYVCDYGPAGNQAKQDDPMARYKPYNIGGTRGAECPNTFDADMGLCNCQGKACRNGGSVDPNTCQCNCINRPWIKRVPEDTLCQLECANAKDAAPCESMGGTMKHEECLAYYNVGHDICPIMCKWCPQNDGEYWKPGNLLVESEESIEEQAEYHPGNHDVDAHLPDCSAPDLAKCGQPDSSGYWPAHYCIYAEVENSCPAMCGKCKASSCVSHAGKTYQLSTFWVNPFGRFTCYADGVEQEQGCNKNGHFVASKSSYAYEEGFTHWTCTCIPNDRGGHMLSCSGS